MTLTHRIFIELVGIHAVDASHLFAELTQSVQISTLRAVRIATIYDIFGISQHELARVIPKVFLEKPRAVCYHSLDECIAQHYDGVQGHHNTINLLPKEDYWGYCAMEYLPGQYDQPADAAEQCLHLLGHDKVVVKTGTLLLLYGDLNEDDHARITQYCINPIEMQEKDVTLNPTHDAFTSSVYYDTRISGFIDFSLSQLYEFHAHMGLGMSIEDLLSIQTYFQEESRDPTLTEIKVLDTYWSDHCRHTTFLTELTDITVANRDSEHDEYTSLYNRGISLYTSLRNQLGIQDPMSLMDMATIGAKFFMQKHDTHNIDISDEINACSIRVPVVFDDDTQEEWLLMFKNETHNHPTEIEPFGGASTCLGGAIRDPLSGRSYVFAGMRISGAANPHELVQDTIPNKLPQRHIVTKSALGFSSYGNQVGIPTCYVREIYHKGYKAKRLEAGFVMGAVPYHAIQRATPVAGDRVLLIGGKTGRDGIGGAVGSSKKHTTQSLQECFAEVQKGNPVEAHALQRLFRNPQAIQYIKRCNDFGAGGVSVAVGEIAEGVTIYLDKLPVKYQGLDGTELALSESQERMAVVCAKEHVDTFITYAQQENLEVIEIAIVTEDACMKMIWKGNTIVNISRAFIDTHGATRNTSAQISQPVATDGLSMFSGAVSAHAPQDIYTKVVHALQSTSLASQQHIQSQFDSTIGARTVLMPYGGHRQESQAEGIAAGFPTDKPCRTVALATASCPIQMLDYSPYHGASYAVVSSLAKIVTMGGDYTQARLTFQEYFPRTESIALWGNPVSAMLGALEAQVSLDVPAIGGKDSMSGNFEDISVPPTFISFSVSSTDIDNVLRTELALPSKEDTCYIYMLSHTPLKDASPNYEQLQHIWSYFIQLSQEQRIVQNAVSIEEGGIFLGLLKMCVGNNVGVHCTLSQQKLYSDFLYENTHTLLHTTQQGSILFASTTVLPESECCTCIGTTQERAYITLDITEISDSQSAVCVEWDLEELRTNWQGCFDNLFPPVPYDSETPVIYEQDYTASNMSVNTIHANTTITSPRVCIPIFPGTNCEYDTAHAFELFGATCTQPVFRNNTSQEITHSLEILVEEVAQSQIIVLAGGFSLGDQPGGAGKYIANILQFPKMAEGLYKLLDRDGLILGVCNGFQALIKSGWLPYGNPHALKSNDAVLTQNTTGVHISAIREVRVENNKSPWLSAYPISTHMLMPFSHGEGQFIALPYTIEELYANQQIATVYSNDKNNPNGSMTNIEGITSKDGKIFGRMGHAERISAYTFKNIPNVTLQEESHSRQDVLNNSLLMFKSGVEYFL